MRGDVHGQLDELPHRGAGDGAPGKRDHPGRLGGTDPSGQGGGNADNGAGGPEPQTSDILTADAFENALRVDLAFGGSTNTSLHLPAIAKEAGVPLTLKTFNAFSDKTPHLCFMSPGGPHDLLELNQAGGIPALMQELSSGGMIRTGAMTVTGKTVGENLAGKRVLNPDVIRPLDKPYHATGGLTVLFGNLAPEGAVVKKLRRRRYDAPAHWTRPRLRLGGAGHAGDPGRQNSKGRRRRDPL